MSWDKFLKPRYIYILSAIYCIILLLVYKVQFSCDSQSYISAWEMFKSGNIDRWRTPVYPFILGFMKFIFGDTHYLLFTVIAQHLIFWVSIKYMYLLLVDIISSEKISFWLTAFYAFYPCAQTYNGYIGTETFAVVGTIFFLYSALRLYKYEKVIYGIGTSFWLLFLVFLRPSSIYLIPILFLFYLWIYIKNKKHKVPSFLFGLGGSIMVGVVLVSYVSIFKNNYGLFTPCGIGVINKYCIARQACIIEPMVSPEEYLKNGFKGCVFDYEVDNTVSLPNVFYESECAITEYGLKEFSDYLDAAISKNRLAYFKRIIVNVQRSSADRLLATAWPLSKLIDIVTINLNFVYLLFIIYITFLFSWMKDNKRICFSLFLFLVGISHMFVIFVASPNDYARLALPIFPVILIMMGQILYRIKLSISSKVEVI